MMHYYELEQPVALTCPECGGTLRVHDDNSCRYYGCHIGHVLTPKTMLIEQFMDLERNLSACLRALNERAELCRQMAERNVTETGRTAGQPSNEWEAARRQALEQAEIIAGVLEREWLHPHACSRPEARPGPMPHA